jgi:hypothetical protein
MGGGGGTACGHIGDRNGANCSPNVAAVTATPTLWNWVRFPAGAVILTYRTSQGATRVNTPCDTIYDWGPFPVGGG